MKIDLRLAGMSNDILGLQTEQNRIKEYLFNRPQSKCRCVKFAGWALTTS